MTKKTLLITLLPSTDVDLGRWILQHHDLAFSERPHAPIFHVLALKYWGFGAEEYPLLIARDGSRTPTDPQILTRIEAASDPDKKLLPDAANEPGLFKQVDAAQHFARFDVGNAVVAWSYFNLLQHKSAVWSSITTGVPWYEKLTCLLAFPVIRTLMYKGLKLDQAASDAALKQIYVGFDHFDALLADGREFLVGDRLTYADLAVSASLAPMILAQGYQGFLPNQAACPPFMSAIYQELRQRPTGLFVQQIYDRHRPI